MGVRAARQEGGGAGCCGSSDRLRGERARPSRSASSGEELATSGPTEGVRPAALKVDQIPIDRVTAPDLMLIWPEEEGWPQEIGALAILDGLSLFDPHGEFLIDPIRERVNRRLHLAPRFRQILYWPRSGLGWPVWGDERPSTSRSTSGSFRCRRRATSSNSSRRVRSSGGDS